MDPATQAAPGYFVWEVAGQPVVVHLRLDVVDRLGAEILRGFGAVPKRGAEVGGILVGDIEPGDISIIRIEDFEAVPCKYVRGPSYLLTEYERMLFDEVCERRSPESAGHTYAVGYYRSHTRDGLGLEPEDVALLDRYFQLPTHVALVVKPYATKASVGGFFVRKNGAFPAATPLEFPFRRWEMTGQEPPQRPTLQESKQKETEPAARAPSERRDQQPEARAPKSRAGMWMVAAFVFLLLGVLLGYEASRITAPRRASDFALSLAVDRTGQNLTVHWNPNAPAVRAASNGVLEIDDGGELKRVELDRANLSNGSMVYRNASDKVHFRLVVYLDSGLSVTEELGWSR
ncbi:MAG: hypothetical protein JWO19_5551 [Bryobacterales bacterium]|jgi:hypothetical protein|nr:hypothetical protein [Bryobacterales bacterium]